MQRLVNVSWQLTGRDGVPGCWTRGRGVGRRGALHAATSMGRAPGPRLRTGDPSQVWEPRDKRLEDNSIRGLAPITPTGFTSVSAAVDAETAKKIFEEDSRLRHSTWAQWRVFGRTSSTPTMTMSFRS